MLTSEYSANKLNGALWRQEELEVSDVQSNTETKILAKLVPFLIVNNNSAFIEVNSLSLRGRRPEIIILL